jgi:hypothetical protein
MKKKKSGAGHGLVQPIKGSAPGLCMFFLGTCLCMFLFHDLYLILKLEHINLTIDYTFFKKTIEYL